MNRTGRPPAVTPRAVVLIAAVLIAATIGGWRAVSMGAVRPDPSTLVVNGVSYTVSHAEQVHGLSDSALGGMSHGIQSLVTDDKALVTLHLVVTAGDSPASYDAGVLRVFTADSAAGEPPVGGLLTPGRLAPHSSIEGYLSFVVPRNGAQVALGAPGDSREVPLLAVDEAPAGAGAHLHPSTTPTAGESLGPASH